MDRIQIKRNAPPAVLYEDAIRNEGAVVSSSGALINFSGKKTGRSPKDKRIVYEETSRDEIWWGSVNIKMDERKFPTPYSRKEQCTELSRPDTFEINRERAIDYLNTRDNVYVFDGYAGVSVSMLLRVLCSDLDLSPSVGSQVPHQSARNLRSRLPRSLHGEFYFFPSDSTRPWRLHPKDGLPFAIRGSRRGL